jgi:hypothetical protein
VERIEPDGTIVLTDTAQAVLKEIVGVQCRDIPLKESDRLARELGARLRELGQRHGVNLKVH